MKFTILNTALLASSVAAFPAMDATAAPFLEKALLEARQNRVAPQGVGALPLAPPPFIAALQRVSTSGKYKVRDGDARGPCPGLNAMANHGYIPHNGIATRQQFIDGTNAVFGMARDLGGFLANYGAFVDGDGEQWSIRGVPHTGIAGSHGNYETDSSPLRADLNQYGSNSRLIMSQFNSLYARQPDAATANYNLEVLRDFRGERFLESINKNPYFTYNPFAGILVSQAAFTFIYRFMGNKSLEYPEGVLNKANLKSFMSIEGDENNLRWNPGHERIPDNWYKRNQADEYSIPYFFSDVRYFAETQPEILAVGCNQGRVNSYNGIDPSVLSGGAYSSADVAKNPGCFASSFLAASAGQSSDSQIKAAASQISGLVSGLGCAPITALNTTSFSLCPGFSRYGGPEGPVAPGAIQN
ncbi:oxidase like protein [Zymoseptoria brevis]|uniref:Oxidase like protein n=1 Tax=Zymoseptoria brevis TaxID=1047168 RepID=A0A0F4GBL1_9PEZI|nr:oxidase like protein [Zymoseptoria brevis]